VSPKCGIIARDITQYAVPQSFTKQI